MWLQGFYAALSTTNLFWLLIGTAWGLIVGVLPAIGANFGVVMALPFTYGMDPATAIIFLVTIHATCNYGDSVASIVLNIPGAPSTVATCWDGYPLAQQGKAGKALGIATMSSFIGGLGTWFFLALLVGPITAFALSIGAPEYFALVVMALGLISVASKGETIKGLVMASFGLALSTVGQDEASGLTFRFAYGIPALEAGIPIVVSVLGVFALSQVIVMLEEGGTVIKGKTIEVKDSILSGFAEAIKRPLTLLRGGAVGWFIGILPALGTSVAGIAAYLVEKRYSKEASQFGKGAPAGLVAAEVGKGACVVGDLIPTFTLGVPGSITGAIIMAALIIHGIEPGPKFLQSGSLPYTVFAGMVLAQASFLLSGVLLGKFFTRIIYCPKIILAPAITVLIFLGVYANSNSDFDFFLALFFGVFSYASAKVKYPAVCLVLGLILGPLVEANFHRSLGISFGSYSIFVIRPIAASMLLITVLFLMGPYLWHFINKGRVKVSNLEIDAGEGRPEPRVSPGELILLGIIAFILSAFLITAQQYSRAARLFPSLVSVSGLIFILWRFSAIIRRISFPNRKWIRPNPLFSGNLSWQWSILILIGYILLMLSIGFTLASALFVFGVILLTHIGRQKWISAVLAGLLVGLAVYVFSRIAHFQLPSGFLDLI